jgi:hypothetical protein
MNDKTPLSEPQWRTDPENQPNQWDDLDPNEAFEYWAKAFKKKYGFLPRGKDDKNPPSRERVEAALAQSFTEIRVLECENERLNNLIEDTGKHLVAHAHGMRRRRVKGTCIFETIFD